MVCKLYGELLNAKAPVVETVSEASAKLTAVLAAMKEAHKKAVSMKVFRKKEMPWMTKELKELIRQRNRYRRSMHNYRKRWQDVSKVIAEKTIENMRNL